MGKDDILSKAAILQRDQTTYAIIAPLPNGVMDVPTARRIADTAQRFGVTRLKVTGAQRLALLGVREEDIDGAYESLGVKPQQGGELCRQYIKVCPGNSFCSRGQQDTLGFAHKVWERFYPVPKITAKVKIGVAGCYNSCVEPAIKDIGLIGLPKGWVIMVGGAGGKDPMLGEIIARNLDDERALEVMEKILKYYRGVSSRPQTRNQRLGVILAREGKGPLLRACGLE
ncbi:MAG: NAD(P)/FAD-dependent oxidoreductase [Syntrophobacteraceae bacterium]|nr:NAD(P)/FAD-dependent oxidoreductase [Syntrophobacteraceae bacterium]